MMEAEREKLREMREKDETMLTEFIEFLKEKKVEVVDSI
jgi:adenylate/nucleoside-diphosphate kinase